MDAQKKKITLATAERIRHFRKDRGLSQEALALKANLNPAYFGQIERGAKCPTVDTLYKISTALELPLPELLRFDHALPEQEADYQKRLQALLEQIPRHKEDDFIHLLESLIAMLG